VSTTPKISIITPSFNQASFIEQTIRSVLEQDYSNLEYIVIDGGSTDGSVDIIRKYSDRIAYWVSEKDRGQTHAINKGLVRATGDIVAYLNSDDFYVEGALARVAGLFNRQPELDLIHGRCRVVDENGIKTGERAGSITRYDEILDLWNVWWNRRNFVQPEVFWTKRISDRIGPFREDLYWVMDYEYWLRILRAGGRVGFIDSELAAFRMQPNQKSTQPERTAAELLKVVRPYIFEAGCPLARTSRLKLTGEWTFHTGFLKEVEESLAHGEGRPQRWLRLARFSVRHPHMLAGRGFRRRLARSLSFARAG
jgi:glycosyltransferase involved in cell wall biosynthesis